MSFSELSIELRLRQLRICNRGASGRNAGLLVCGTGVESPSSRILTTLD